ncbi:hypothetical protein MLD38_000067 [Melastoma candidum]|nr:hypothetical protein MLD38_000067 [Melastoma candidum]
MDSEMKVFAVDCLLECFDKGYRRCCNIGYRGWKRQLSSWSPEMLSQDIVEKVRRWADLSGLTPDKITEDDMSNALGKWTDFNVEAFELGAAFADDVLKDLVEDIVVSISRRAC